MQTVSTVFERELAKLIEEEKARIADILLRGNAVADISDYKHYTGQAVALDNVLGYFNAVNEKLSKTK